MGPGRLFLFLLILFLAGCAASPTAAPTPAPTAPSTPATPSPSPASPTPTLTSTLTSTPTPEPTPTPTPTEEPTPTPAPEKPPQPDLPYPNSTKPLYRIGENDQLIGPLQLDRDAGVVWDNQLEGWVAVDEQGVPALLWIPKGGFNGEGRWWQISDKAKGPFFSWLVLNDTRTWEQIRSRYDSGLKDKLPNHATRIINADKQTEADRFQNGPTAPEIFIYDTTGFEADSPVEGMDMGLLWVLKEITGLSAQELKEQIQSGELSQLELELINGKKAVWDLSKPVLVAEFADIPSEFELGVMVEDFGYAIYSGYFVLPNGQLVLLYAMPWYVPDADFALKLSDPMGQIVVRNGLNEYPDGKAGVYEAATPMLQVMLRYDKDSNTSLRIMSHTR